MSLTNQTTNNNISKSVCLPLAPSYIEKVLGPEKVNSDDAFNTKWNQIFLRWNP